MRSLSFLRKFVAQCSNQIPKGISESLFSKEMHYKCRNAVYPGSTLNRFIVPDDKVSWKVSYDEYSPPTYTSNGVLGKEWADPVIGSPGFNPEWNSDKSEINRLCGSHVYDIDADGYPINPVGRTGIKGRGVLGRWGSNCAGDCIVTRWKRDPMSNSVINDSESGKGILEFLAIKRKDCGEWAIPGGFADRSENFMDTVKREFFEEALNSNVGFFDLQAGKTEVAGGVIDDPEKSARRKLDEIFKNGSLVYSGYVDDRRNTDQAWISTNAVNIHDDFGVIFNAMKFEAGDDAADVKWMEISNQMKLYANHKSFVQAAAEKIGAYF